MGNSKDVKHQNDTVSVHGADGKIETNYSTKGKNTDSIPTPRALPDSIAKTYLRHGDVTDPAYKELELKYNLAVREIKEISKNNKNFFSYGIAEKEALNNARAAAEAFNALTVATSNVDGPHEDLRDRFVIFSVASEEARKASEKANLRYIAIVEERREAGGNP